MSDEVQSQIITKQVKSTTEKCIAPAGYIPIPVLSWHKHQTPYYKLSPYYLKTDGNETNVNPGGIIF